MISSGQHERTRIFRAIYGLTLCSKSMSSAFWLIRYEGIKTLSKTVYSLTELWDCVHVCLSLGFRNTYFPRLHIFNYTIFSIFCLSAWDIWRVSYLGDPVLDYWITENYVHILDLFTFLPSSAHTDPTKLTQIRKANELKEEWVNSSNQPMKNTHLIHHLFPQNYPNFGIWKVIAYIFRWKYDGAPAH